MIETILLDCEEFSGYGKHFMNPCPFDEEVAQKYFGYIDDEMKGECNAYFVPSSTSSRYNDDSYHAGLPNSFHTRHSSPNSSPISSRKSSTDYTHLANHGQIEYAENTLFHPYSLNLKTDTDQPALSFSYSESESYGSKQLEQSDGESYIVLQPISESAHESESGYIMEKEVECEVKAGKGRRRHECVECGKRFVRPAELQRHMRVHNGDRPFNCGQCAESFKRKDHLKSHMVKHAQVKAFKCDTCEYATNRKDTLKRHQKKHSRKL